MIIWARVLNERGTTNIVPEVDFGPGDRKEVMIAGP